MPKRFHLLNGETLDLEQQLTYPFQPIEDEYTAHFADESNPWWLSFDTDNGSQSFAGLASAGGQGTTQLNTGGTTAGDLSMLETPALNWDNWSELWFLVSNDPETALLSAPTSAQVYVTLGDNRDPTAMTDGVKVITNTNNQSVTWKILNGGTTQMSGTTAHRESSMFGFRLFENVDNTGSSGHTIMFYSGWRPLFQHAEDAGFPSIAEYPLRVGCRSDDGSDQYAELDTVYLGLMA